MTNTMARIVTLMLLAAGGARASIGERGPAMDLLGRMTGDSVMAAFPVPGLAARLNLREAVKARDAIAVESLLRSPNAAVNEKDAAGWTPLMEAVVAQDERIVLLLLSHPLIDVNARNSHRVTALMLAASGGPIGILDALLARSGTNLDMKDEDGRTALMYAATGDNGPAVARLLSREANPDLRDNNGATAIDIARMFGHRRALSALS